MAISAIVVGNTSSFVWGFSWGFGRREERGRVEAGIGIGYAIRSVRYDFADICLAQFGASRAKQPNKPCL